MLFPPSTSNDIIIANDLQREIERLNLKEFALKDWLKNNFQKLNYFELNISGIDKKLTSKDLPALKNTKTIFCIILNRF